MGSEERIESKAMTTHTPDGRDELNLAEFPLSALSHRLQSDQKTVQFEDQIRDDCRGEMISVRPGYRRRLLRITAVVAAAATVAVATMLRRRARIR